MKKTFYIFILSLFSMVIYSQIKPNETLIFSGSYELKGLMTNIAQVTLRTESMKTTTKTYMHLSLEAATFSKWDSFFKIRDLYESYVDPNTLKPSLYKRKISEGGYNKTEKYTFTSNGTSINSSTIKGAKPEVKNTFRIGSTSVDVVTLIYKIRTIDFSKLKTGQSMPFTVVFNQKEFPITLKLMGIETVSAGNLGKKACYKLSIGAKTNALRGTDKNLIWLSTDSNHIPCLVKFSIPVGVGQLTLLKATGI